MDTPVDAAFDLAPLMMLRSFEVSAARGDAGVKPVHEFVADCRDGPSPAAAYSASAARFAGLHTMAPAGRPSATHRAQNGYGVSVCVSVCLSVCLRGGWG